MNDLVTIYKQQLVTDSRTVAEHFGKQHKHVLEAIDNLVAENSATKNMFLEQYREYRGQSFRYYLMSRDGFDADGRRSLRHRYGAAQEARAAGSESRFPDADENRR